MPPIRLATGVRLATGLLIGGLVVPLLTPTPADAATTRPGIVSLRVSHPTLPDTGGRLRLHARLHDATRCTLRVKPALKHHAVAKHCAGGSVRWTTRLPANPHRHARRYVFSLTAKGHGHAVTRRRAVRVAATPPPRLGTITQSAASLDSNGGTVRFTAAVANTRRCRLTVTPAILGLPSTKACTHRSVGWTTTVPPNPVGTPATYTFTLTGIGTDGRSTSKQRSVTVAAQDPTCPGQTSTATPATSTYFNDPTTNSPQDQDAVVTAMINLICNVSPPPAGRPSRIDLAMYTFQLEEVTQALLWAHQYRGADVHVALDGANTVMENDANQTVPNQAYLDLNNGLPSGSIVLCGPNAGTAPPPPIGDDTREADQRRPAERRAADTSTVPKGTSCAGDNILHSKLLLVSSVDTRGDAAVFTGSQNFNTHAEVAAFNNGLQVVGSSALYRDNLSYVERLLGNARDPRLGDTMQPKPVTVGGAQITSLFFPRNASATFPTAYSSANDSATDNVADLLKGVSCSDPGAYAGDHSATRPRTTVRLAVYSYGNRPKVTDQLAALAGAGCDVQVLYTNMTDKTLSALQGAGIQPLQLSDDSYPYADGSGTGRVFVHDKYLLVSGGYGSTTNQDLVLTGSQNLTQPALHDNDDQALLVRVTAAGSGNATAVYDAYAADWARVAQVAESVQPAP